MVEFASTFVGDAFTFDRPTSILKMCDEGGPTCNYATYPGGGYPSFIADASGVATKDCVRRVVPFRDAVADGSEWTDYEYVWYGRF